MYNVIYIYMYNVIYIYMYMYITHPMYTIYEAAQSKSMTLAGMVYTLPSHQGSSVGRIGGHRSAYKCTRQEGKGKDIHPGQLSKKKLPWVYMYMYMYLITILTDESGLELALEEVNHHGVVPHLVDSPRLSCHLSGGGYRVMM